MEENIEDYPIIAMGCPVQNREKILSKYLESLYELDYPKSKIHLMFLVNNSKDDSYLILEEFKENHKDEYKVIDVWDIYGIANGYVDSRNKRRDYEAFATIRNAFISMIDDTDEYLYSIDSDILVPSYSLKQLILHDKDMCSLLVNNGMDFFNILKERTFQGKFNHYYEFPRKLIEVDCTGSAVLIKRKIIEDGVRYGFHRQGEDCSFCQNVKLNSFEIWCDASIKAKHLMG
jgi:cellulose synthase/poly-beta-1,6-N-acetylglucosamine synthase-like glycosyltransferase